MIKKIKKNNIFIRRLLHLCVFIIFKLHDEPRVEFSCIFEKPKKKNLFRMKSDIN